MPEGVLTVEDLEGKAAEEMIAMIHEEVIERYDEKEAEMSEEHMREFEKVVFFVRLTLNGWIILMRWISCVKVFIYVLMDKLIHFANINRKDLRCSRKWLMSIEDDAAKYVMKAEIRNNLEREEVAKGQAVNPKEDGEVKKKPVSLSQHRT